MRISENSFCDVLCCSSYCFASTTSARMGRWDIVSNNDAAKVCLRTVHDGSETIHWIMSRESKIIYVQVMQVMYIRYHKMTLQDSSFPVCPSQLHLVSLPAVGLIRSWASLQWHTNNMKKYGGFHSHGGTPIAGWFVREPKYGCHTMIQNRGGLERSSSSRGGLIIAFHFQ